MLGTYHDTPVCHDRLGVLGRGPLSQTHGHTNLRRATAPSLWCCIADKATRGNLLGLCCDRIVELILCRSSRRPVNCHVETLNARFWTLASRCHMVVVVLPSDLSTTSH